MNVAVDLPTFADRPRNLTPTNTTAHQAHSDLVSETEITVVVVEDDPTIAASLEEALQREGYTCHVARDGPAGLELARGRDPDLVVLDLMLPGMDGFSVCRELRRESDVPVLMLTARDGETDQVLGFELGADDYVVKPFSLTVLLSRIRALLRRGARGGEEGPPVYDLGALVVDTGRRVVTAAGAEVELTSTEFDLLAYLAASPGRAYTREQLLEAVWGYTFEGYKRTVDTHVTRLRKKIEPDPSDPTWILTVYKVGYKFREELP